MFVFYKQKWKKNEKWSEIPIAQKMRLFNMLINDIIQSAFFCFTIWNIE